MPSTIIWLSVGFVLLIILTIIIFASFRVVKQGTFGVLTRFGQYKRALSPGLNVVNPFFDKIFTTVSTQNQSTELSFQAITHDQANVFFKAMVLYAVKDGDEETIKLVAFKFIDQSQFLQAIQKTIEGVIRSFVATKNQAEILSLRSEIVLHTKTELDALLATWGYHLLDVQVNDITFDKQITDSMAQVVSSNNLKVAATNQGDALLITKTKQAEAEGNFIKIQAAAERDAATLRGQGIAAFREEVAKGLLNSQQTLAGADMDASVILFTMWTETMRQVASEGKGNIIFFDGSIDGQDRTLKSIMALLNQNKTTGV